VILTKLRFENQKPQNQSVIIKDYFVILTVLRTENQKATKPICNLKGLLRDPYSAPH
jgi:hypothetical protein